jgi:hypothetical protein
MIHLTETGYNAGRLFCINTMSADDTKAHGAYAPLHLADFRGKCCSDCLKVWALEAYDDTDTDAPEWVLSIRQSNAQ